MNVVLAAAAVFEGGSFTVALRQFNRTVEWIASDRMAELPVMPATTNLVAAMATLAAMAP